MADEKPKKLSLKEIAERAAKTQPQVSPGAPARVTYAPGDPVGSQPPTSRPSQAPLSSPPSSTPPGSIPPGSAPPRPSGAPSTPPASVPPASAAAKPTEEPPSTKADASAKKGEKAEATKEKKGDAKKADAKKPEDKKDEPASPLPLLVGGIVLVSIAALVYAMVKRPQPGPSATPLATTSAAVVTAAPSASAAPTASTPTPTGDLDINALGAVASADPGKHGPLGKDPKDKDKDKTAGAGGDKKPDTPPAATSAVALGPAGELSDEIKKRMGGAGGGKAEGDSPGGPSPDAKESHPSPGAVAGALNAVRGAARACLADTEDVARVNIVFASSGSVQSASVTGTKAEGCVKSAMMKAKVAPFTDPTFSTSVTIRP